MPADADSTVPRPLARREVPLLDLKAQYRSFKAEVIPAIERVCDSQSFILGREVLALEAAIASYSGAAHGVGVSSGTDALLLALMALDIAPGDEVLTTTFTFFATGGTIARLGARPVFLDIDPRTYNLSPAAVEEYIAERCVAGASGLSNRSSGARVRALMPVHLYGQCADLGALGALARRHGLKLIEDAAQAIGSELADGTRAGSVGEVGCFSFFPSKNLGAFGDAGLCTTQDAGLAERMRVLRVHGGKPKYFHAEIGGNFRLDELQAAVLNVKLRHLDGWTAGRQRNAGRYAELFRAARLETTVGLPPAVPGYRHIYNQYVIRAPDRDRLKRHLAERGIGSEIYYPVPLHLQACFSSLGGRAGDCPQAERAAAETLALPVYAELSVDALEYVVDAIRAFYA
jgi:dTDP-4-amino-4,6-dideoxygalactose transaminase